MKSRGYAALNSKDPLKIFEFERRDIKIKDVLIEILYCGICHSDIHTARSEWQGTNYPLVPGHEILGRVLKVGPQVKNYKEGDIVAVGCFVDSCRKCSCCLSHNEQYCQMGATFTYNSPDPYLGGFTYGGYSNCIVVDKDYVLRVPSTFKEKDWPGVAPLLCAGITTYSPLKHWKVGKNSHVGVVGLGGLGHMAVKLAHAMGAKVTLFTSSKHKIADGKKLGADQVIITSDMLQFESVRQSMDFIINTVAISHDLNPYIECLKLDGVICLVGVPEKPHKDIRVYNLVKLRRSIAGSLIGGIKETQEMLDFCAKHQLTADVEVIPPTKINEAYERMLKSDVKYRFSIDMSCL